MPVRKVRKLATAALLAATCVCSPAAADERPLPAADLARVMAAYAETTVELRDLYAACAPTPPAGWEEGAALLVESLRAAGLGEAALAAISARLAAAVRTDGVACDAPEHQLRAQPDGADWPAFHRAALEAAGVAVVVPAAGDERLAAARAAVDAALPLQAHMLQCLSLFDPRNFVAAYAEWDRLIERAAGAFAGAGYPVHVYAPILEPAAAGRLFAPPADRAAATAACAADQAWYDRFATFAWYTIAGDVEAALGSARP